mmetsp:Transcript_19984/g.43007  ORF Transcript_19984/g.43007 Transcript_19984/m.43007 type:complete len:121 (+) Transcript_19984:470-832(+)
MVVHGLAALDPGSAAAAMVVQLNAHAAAQANAADANTSGPEPTLASHYGNVLYRLILCLCMVTNEAQLSPWPSMLMAAKAKGASKFHALEQALLDTKHSLTPSAPNSQWSLLPCWTSSSS